MSNIDMSRMVSAEDKARAATVATLEAEVAEQAAYLAATDWYVTRFAETGTAVPEEVRAARTVARDRVSEIRDQLRA
ncbi:hypothetical protein VK792_15485 [Mesobacterium sp. TK19101]|uniref:Uncharacterized protein n=1 Tax=Mesobacterium hydrothermale TaxID=3111907 RepID=A0ABU6HJS7_9RHOB|nr:hypothetical protein [Mesobacterium sp. TK19101]MEC3862693.1 hypothetical protein [Mesobacterium sp. TK19101]